VTSKQICACLTLVEGSMEEVDYYLTQTRRKTLSCWAWWCSSSIQFRNCAANNILPWSRVRFQKRSDFRSTANNKKMRKR